MRGLVFRSMLLTALLGGCTHLEVIPYDGEAQANRSGYAYMLDFTQYQITLKRTLVSCKDGAPPEVKTDATATAVLAPDGEQVYVVDPRSMISAFKTSDVSIEYKDGRLVGFNASTVDKTGEVIQSVAVTAGKVATLAAGIPLPVQADGKAFQYCTDEARTKLEAVKTGTKATKAATEQLDEARAKLAVVTAQFAAKPTERLRLDIAKRNASIKAGQDGLDKLAATLNAAQEWLGETQTFRWPERSTVYHEGPLYRLRIATAQRWFRVDEIREAGRAASPAALVNHRLLRNGGPTGNAALLGMGVADFASAFPALADGTDVSGCPAAGGQVCREYGDLIDRLSGPQVDAVIAPAVSLHLVRSGSYGAEWDGKGQRGSAKDGLRYRVPAAGTLFICDNVDPCQLQAASAKPVATLPGPIAQLGTVFNIPFSSPAFASGGVSVTFDEQGRLLKAGLKRDNSAALAAAGAVGSAADQATAFAKALQEAPTAELGVQTRLLKAQKELADAQAAVVKTPTQLALDEFALLDAQQKVAAAKRALDPDPTRDLTTQVQIAKLQVDLATQAKLLQADPQADLAAVRAQYDATTALLNARRSSLEAEAAVVAAERALAAARAAQ